MNNSWYMSWSQQGLCETFKRRPEYEYGSENCDLNIPFKLFWKIHVFFSKMLKAHTQIMKNIRFYQIIEIFTANVSDVISMPLIMYKTF